MGISATRCNFGRTRQEKRERRPRNSFFFCADGSSQTYQHQCSLFFLSFLQVWHLHRRIKAYIALSTIATLVDLAIGVGGVVYVLNSQEIIIVLTWTMRLVFCLRWCWGGGLVWGERGRGSRVVNVTVHSSFVSSVLHLSCFLISQICEIRCPIHLSLKCDTDTLCHKAHRRSSTGLPPCLPCRCKPNTNIRLPAYVLHDAYYCKNLLTRVLAPLPFLSRPLPHHLASSLSPTHHPRHIHIALDTIVLYSALGVTTSHDLQPSATHEDDSGQMAAPSHGRGDGAEGNSVGQYHLDSHRNHHDRHHHGDPGYKPSKGSNRNREGKAVVSFYPEHPSVDVPKASV